MIVFRLRCFACLWLLALGCLQPATAEEGSAAPVVQAAPPAADPFPQPSGSIVEHRNASFKELGVESPLRVRGADSNGLSLSLRRDRLVARARLKLSYTASPALLSEVSHIKILLNGEVVGVIPLGAGDLGTARQQEIALDPRYFSDYNRLNFELAARTSQDCGGAWLSVSNTSRLELDLVPLALQNDLALLPAPFFDKLDNTRLTLPFVFSTQPTFETLQPAGTVASWFGVLADWRGADFPVLLDHLPEGNAIVFSRNHDRFSELTLPPVQGPSLSVVAHPRLPWAKLLLIQGRDDNDLKAVAIALALGRVTFSGERVAVEAVDPGPRRPAYDAPKWLQTGMPIPFRQLVENPESLQVRGYDPSPITLSARLPPDLFVWNAKGVPIDLRYRYTPPAAPDASTLTVSLDGRFVQSYALGPGGKSGENKRLTLPLFEPEPAARQQTLSLPALRPGSPNLLAFKFTFDTHDLNECKAASEAGVFAAVDEDSSIDLSRFPHYLALPDLAAFVGAGFPYSKYADLAETVLVLPDHPAPADMHMMLSVLGIIGKTTGAPALRHRVVPASDALRAGDADLMIFDAAQGGNLPGDWQRNTKILFPGNTRELLSRLASPVAANETIGQSGGHIALHAVGPFSAISGFESPLEHGRSIIAFGSNGEAAAQQLLDALLDPKRAAQIRGDLTVIRDGSVESYRTTPLYFSGKLPLWLRLWLLLSHHPLLLATAGIAVSLVAGYWLTAWQRRRGAAAGES